MDLNRALKHVLTNIPEEVKEVFREHREEFGDYIAIDNWCLVDTPYGVVDVNLVGVYYCGDLVEGEISLGVYPTWICNEGYIHTDWANWESEHIPVEMLE